jgi:hypothetical protein
MATVVPFDRLKHFYRLPVQVAGEHQSFLLDTGIGITVVSPDLAAQYGFEHTGESYAGRRMSGQVVEAPLVRLPELLVGPRGRGAARLRARPRRRCGVRGDPDLGGLRQTPSHGRSGEPDAHHW